VEMGFEKLLGIFWFDLMTGAAVKNDFVGLRI
jgi:hypothetical protein